MRTGAFAKHDVASIVNVAAHQRILDLLKQEPGKLVFVLGNGGYAGNLVQQLEGGWTAFSLPEPRSAAVLQRMRTGYIHVANSAFGCQPCRSHLLLHTSLDRLELFVPVYIRNGGAFVSNILQQPSCTGHEAQMMSLELYGKLRRQYIGIDIDIG
ncbi:hypothetical protein D3C73_708100 [compost metagenome]